MVRALLILLLVVLGPRALGEALRFQMEFSRPDIYAGEITTVHFVLYAREDIVEVEVAKFPEFRGYWSENLALRQGPMPMLPDGTGEWRRAVVGSYLISSMLDDGAPEIRPMRIVVRRPMVDPNIGPGSTQLLSEGAPLRLKPLPDPGPGAPFVGGVGRFTFHVERNPIYYQKGEPTLIRLLVNGEGNFRELHELPLPPTEGMELLSRKTYSQGSAQFQTKVFDLTVRVDREGDFTLPPFSLRTFDPLTGTYQESFLPELNFLPAPLPQGEATPAPLDWGVPVAQWSSPLPWHQNPTWFVFQFWALVLSLCAAAQGFHWSDRWRARQRRRHPVDPLQEQFAAAVGALERGDVDRFLREADDIAYQTLRRRLPGAAPHRPDLLRLARTSLKEETVAQATRLFEAWGLRAYSASKALPPETSPLLTDLRSLVRSAA